MAAISYDAGKDCITGDKLMIFIDVSTTETPELVPIAFATTSSLSLTADTIETSSKMSGNFKAYLTGQVGFTISCEALYTKKEGAVSYEKLKDLMVARKPISFSMAGVTGDAAAGTLAAATPADVSGKAIITSLEIKFDNGSIVSCSASMQGTGALS